VGAKFPVLGQDCGFCFSGVRIALLLLWLPLGGSCRRNDGKIVYVRGRAYRCKVELRFYFYEWRVWCGCGVSLSTQVDSDAEERLLQLEFNCALLGPGRRGDAKVAELVREWEGGRLEGITALQKKQQPARRSRNRGGVDEDPFPLPRVA